MKCVGVRHKPEHSNLFWFEVPESLEAITQIGTQVICDTRKGNSTGVVDILVEGLDSIESIEFFKGLTPLKRIIAAKKEFELSDIHIPWDMASSAPSSDKITKRINEFYTTGAFQTPIICGADGNLQDGYTAYLVARMFGHDTLSAFCISSTEKEVNV